jgi:pullulanase
MSTPEASFADRVKMNNLSAAIVLTSQGIPFIHAGEEMLRSKPLEDGSFDHNSYRSSDAVNNLKWADMRGEEYQLTYAYYQGLIAFRKAHPALTMTSAGEVAEKITKLGGLDFNVVGFHIAAGANGEENELIVVFNPNPAASTVTLPEGQWTVYINGEKAGVEPLGTASGTATAEPISAMVLVKASSEAAPSIGIIGGADGPTAVLVSGNWGGLAAMAAAVLCAGIAVIVALKNRKK